MANVKSKQAALTDELLKGRRDPLTKRNAGTVLSCPGIHAQPAVLLLHTFLRKPDTVRLA